MTVSVRKNGKRVAALLLALVLALSVCPFAVHAEETEARTTEYVHLRSGPGTNYDSQGVLAEGTVLTVTDTSNSEWYAVRTSGGTTGYIFSQYIAIGGSDSGSAAKTTEYVHLRSGPGTNYSSKGVIASGTAITVTDTSNSEWYAVRLSNGTTGYMFSEYISMSGGSSSSGSDSVPSTESTAAKVTEYVNVRSGPGTNYTSKTVIASGTSITVTDRSNAEWYAVKLSNGMTGYIFSQYIKLSNDSSSDAGSVPSTESTPAKTTEYVNVRSGPGTNYTSKTVIASGTSITVTDRSNSEWYAVKLSNGMTGYIFSIYIELESGSSSGGGSSSSESVRARTTAGVNVRSGPGTNYSSKTVIASGTSITVTDRSNSEWYAVKLSNGMTGYIYSIYIRIEDESSSGGSSGTESTPAKTTEYVNVRSGPGTNYTSKTVIASGTSITVTDTSNPEWYAVKLSNGMTGYIYSIYIELQSSAGGGSTSGGVQAKTTAGVNLRRGAGTSFGVIRVVATGTTVTVTEATNAQWYKVKLSDGTEGYIFTEYLNVISGDIDSVKPDEDDTPDTSGAVTARTTTDINLRRGPGTTYGVIMVVDENVTVTVTEATNSEWYKVRLSDGTEGYFSAQYLKIVSGDIDSVKPDDSGDKEDEDDGGSSDLEGTGEYLRTTTGVNLRKGPSTSTDVLTVLNSGTIVEVIDRDTQGWVHVRTTSGRVGYVSADYVTAYTPSGSNGSVSTTSATIAQYKTLYIEGSGSSVIWTSSDTSVARVEAGVDNQLFVYGVAPGTAKIVGKGANGKELASCTVTVTAPEAVRFAYTTPNIISAGSSFDLKAVTDTQKSSVKFEIQGVGTYETSSYTSESQGDNSVRIFSASATINTPGTYTVRAYSNSGSGYSSTYKEFTILVVSTTDKTSTSNEARRISDEMLENIASYEGYVPGVSPDTLAGNLPTVGYGYVVAKNTSFYNNLTRTEAKAMLAETVNSGGYTSDVNYFISQNGLQMSQCQFDALVSFGYNVGSSYWRGYGSCYVRTVILNTVVPPSNLSSSNPYGGKVTSTTLTIYSDHSDSSSRVGSLSEGNSVSIIGYWRDDSTKHAWYQVTASGKTGWVRAGDVAFNNTSGLTRDLNYVDAYTFGSNLLDWHVAGGRCYIGLYYRRLAEAKVFSYANYSEASPSSANYKVNTYGYDVPTCL
ncbi:MAG TPA: SH3 domain-containing protein [Candidatus Ruminococcus gallistercoris]|nr:SH3 domain-containing protein [Candidatus Ruminococcus gallistercoris]